MVENNSHNHSDWYRYTGVHKNNKGEELFEYKCEKCGKIEWLREVKKLCLIVEKKVEDELIKWEV